MRFTILTTLVLVAAVSNAAVTHTPIKSGVALKPGQSYTAAVASSAPAEIGWTAVQPKHCTMHCVKSD